MQNRLELKILTLVVVLLTIGIIIAGFMVLTIEKKSLYDITELSSESASQIIAKDIERTMLEGRAESTKNILEDLKSIGGIEEITVLNHEGRAAFDKTSPANEGIIMKKIIETKAPFVIRETKRFIFYKPLENMEKCRGCHANDPAVLGAVKILISIEKEYRKATKLIIIVILATILASFCFSIVLWIMIRKMVINPIKLLEKAAQDLSHGDLSFSAETKGSDEIARFSRAVQDAFLSIAGILKQIKEASIRVSQVTEQVERESRKVVEGTIVEAEAIGNISTSVEEMNASIFEIAEGTDSLASSAEETAASMEQMVTSISQIKESTESLSSAVDSTSSSIEQLSATLREVAQNTNDLAAAAADTQSAIDRILMSVDEVEQKSKDSAALSDKVKNDAMTFGMVSVQKTIDGMEQIKTSVERTAECIKKLGGRSEEIGNILTVIDEITDQTTMLALNAAILAAQAGEYGKGFSVVADEIKDLAERTSDSTQEIAVLIQSVQQEVTDAVVAMDDGLMSVETGFKVTNEASEALSKIVESSRRSSEMSAAIEKATVEQSGAANLVSHAMKNMLSMVGQISKATNEQSKGIRHIMSATEKIRDVSQHVRTATLEQSQNTRQISQAMELVSDKSQQISRAINEQKVGSSQIWGSIEKIKDIPAGNRERAFRLNQLVRDLQKDADLSLTEIDRFKFADDSTSGILRMGIVPLEAPAVMFKRFSPLVEYLGRKLGRRIDLKVANDFSGAVSDLGLGITQICFMTPSTYIEAHKQFGVRVLVKALSDGKPFQHCVIIVRDESPIKSIADIRGRSFAFGDPHSTSSHIMPRGMLLDAGIDVKDLLYHNYLGHHDDVAKAVLNGDFDAGGVMEATANKFRDSGLRQIKLSDDIPEFNICVTKMLDSVLLTALKDALTTLDLRSPEGALILKSMNDNYTGFTEASDSDYDNIRTIMMRMKLI